MQIDMKILLIDSSGFFVDFAMRAEAQGHSVRLFMAPDEKTFDRLSIGDGLVNKVPTWQGSMNWADLILISDNCRYMREIEGYRNRGFPIFSANLEGTSWEFDRLKGQEVLESCGIECLPTIKFKNWDEAIAHQMANLGTRYVCKPCSDVDKALSYVSKSAKDMIFMLQHWKRTIKKPCPFIFQEFCPGIEVAVGGWMGRNGFLGHVLENFEFKKLMNDERGPNTGEMGTVMKYVPIAESKLAQELLLPVEADLIRCGYTGYIDVAVMLGTEGSRKGMLNPLEFTSRHGWPLFNIQQVLHPDVANWMKDALEGRDTFQPDPDIAIGVFLSMPDFPGHHLKEKDLSGFPIWGLSKENRYFFHPFQMKAGKGIDDKGAPVPMLVTCGNALATVTGRGGVVRAAKDRAYQVIDQLEIPNSLMYRTDIGDRLEKQLPILQKYGYCTSWIY
jgi:phosphoribosylamine--glycine ligase